MQKKELKYMRAAGEIEKTWQQTLKKVLSTAIKSSTLSDACL
jgi:hypothetical protein